MTSLPDQETMPALICTPGRSAEYYVRTAAAWLAPTDEGGRSDAETAPTDEGVFDSGASHRDEDECGKATPTDQREFDSEAAPLDYLARPRALALQQTSLKSTSSPPGRREGRLAGYHTQPRAQ